MKHDTPAQIEANFRKRQQSVYKKISKPVSYNGKEFESVRSLTRALRLPSSSTLYRHIKKGEYKGKELFYIKK